MPKIYNVTYLYINYMFCTLHMSSSFWMKYSWNCFPPNFDMVTNKVTNS